MDTRDDAEVDAFAGWVFDRVLGGLEALSIQVGAHLGLYDVLATAPCTAEELSERAGIDPRYAREWLEQQATAGILRFEDDRFALPRAHAAVLVDGSSLAYSAPLARMLAAVGTRMPDLIDAYRTGTGVPWAAFGTDMRDGQGDINRPWFEHALADALASVPDLHAVLSRPGARIADVACGHGWSTIALARAYPAAAVDGFDVDGPSIASARDHARGVAGVSFETLPGERLAAAGTDRYDAAFVFEALHDMPDPVAVLTALHAAVRPDGAVVVMDEAVAESFAPPGDEVERIMYGYSLFVCLPDSMSAPGSVATGTVMRPGVLGRYARDAGFSG